VDALRRRASEVVMLASMHRVRVWSSPRGVVVPSTFDDSEGAGSAKPPRLVDCLNTSLPRQRKSRDGKPERR
jgi:hypothetical protein